MHYILKEGKKRLQEILNDSESMIKYAIRNLATEEVSQNPNSRKLICDFFFVPFSKLISAESQARLSVCRPHSSLEEASSTSGVPRYSHITGSVDYRRRAPLQLASPLTEDRSPAWLSV